MAFTLKIKSKNNLTILDRCQDHKWSNKVRFKRNENVKTTFEAEFFQS